MTNRQLPVHIVASSLGVVAVFALVALWAGPVSAQSGRRASKSSPAPAPTPPPEAESVEKKPAEDNQDALSFVVGIDRSAFANIPTYLYDSVLRACVERLDNSPSAKATIANREMSRGEAIKRAKAETESHIVWMQLKVDGTRSQSDDDLREVYIDYAVFAPTTGKIVTNGQRYQQIARAGGVIAMPVPGGRASLPYAEQLLKQAARDAADKILSAMSVSGRKIPS